MQGEALSADVTLRHHIDHLLQELERMERETLQLRQQIEQVRCPSPFPLAPPPCLPSAQADTLKTQRSNAMMRAQPADVACVALQLKVIRAERQRREELLALAELRASVQALHDVDSVAEEQRQQVILFTLHHFRRVRECILMGTWPHGGRL